MSNYTLLHSRTISYSEPQLGHMQSGKPDEQSSWAHFRQFCHWIKFHQVHFLQKFYSTLQWVQDKSLHYKNREILESQLMFKMIYCKNVYFVPTF